VATDVSDVEESQFGNHQKLGGVTTALYIQLKIKQIFLQDVCITKYIFIIFVCLKKYKKLNFYLVEEAMPMLLVSVSRVAFRVSIILVRCI
jgi:hypothetical protein